MNLPEQSFDGWRRCSSCKKAIGFGIKYWVCNVSTCNRKRTGLIFCNVSCWDAHVPMMNHRESWAEERKAPSKDERAKIQAGDEPGKRKTLHEPKVIEDVKPTAPQATAQRTILRKPKSE